MNTRLFIAFIISFLGTYGQTEVTVANGGTENIDIPMDLYYRYCYTEVIYLQSEIATSGNITSIFLEYDGNSAWTQTGIEIYLGHTSKTAFANSSDWITSSGTTLVYTGALSVTTTPGWVEITLDTPFSYNNTDNLVFAIHDPDYDYIGTGEDFYSLSTAAYRTIYYISDTTDPDPASPPSDGTINYVPSFKVKFDDATLPVELISWDAKSEDNIANISWVTATEFNNDYFTLESSSDGVHFETVAQIPGNGTTQDISFYEYNTPLVYQTTYFRLKQTDFDGTEEYLFTTVLNRDDPPPYDLKLRYNGESYLVIQSLEQQDYLLQITDLSGKVVATQSFQQFEGIEKHSLSHLSPGIYVASIITSSSFVSQKIVVK